MGRKKKPEPPENHERWLISYADFITLLFCFFTAMYAIGESDRGKATQFVRSVNTAFHRFDTLMPTEESYAPGSDMNVFSTAGGVGGGGIHIFSESNGRSSGQIVNADNEGKTKSIEVWEGAIEKKAGAGGLGDDSGEGAGLEKLEPVEYDEFTNYGRRLPTWTPTAIPLPTATPGPELGPNGQAESGEPGGMGFSASEFDDIFEQLKVSLEQEDLQDKIELKNEERGLVISLKAASFFAAGHAEMKSGGNDDLRKIAPMILSLNRRIQVDGHTDNTPIQFSAFRSNMVLSSARAIVVWEFLVNNYGFDPGKVGAAGWGEYHPIDTNATEEGRSRNRRVDIVILGAKEATYAMP